MIHRYRQLYTLLLFSALLMAALVWFGVPKAQAATGINSQINYQGKLSNSSGVQVSNDSWSFKFEIWSASSGGTLLWTERWTATTTQVSTVNGVFSAALGSLGQTDTLSSLNWNSDSLYLQVALDANEDGSWEESFATRKRFSAASYAFNADTVDGFHATSTAAVANYLLSLNSKGDLDLFSGGVSSSFATSTGFYFQPRGSAPDALAGRTYYSTNDNTLYVYNGSSWLDALAVDAGAWRATSTDQFGTLLQGTRPYLTPTSSASVYLSKNLVVDDNLNVYGNATTSGWFNIGSTDVINTLAGLIGAGDLFVGRNATTTGNLSVGGFASTTNLILANGASNVTTHYDLYVSGGELFFDGNPLTAGGIITGFGDAGAWRATSTDQFGTLLQGTRPYLTPTSSASVYLSKNLVVDDNLNVYGNATTSGWFNVGTTDVVGTLGSLIGAGDLFVSSNATITNSLEITNVIRISDDGGGRATIASPAGNLVLQADGSGTADIAIGFHGDGLADDDIIFYNGTAVIARVNNDGTSSFFGGMLIDGDTDEVQLTVQGHSTQTNNTFVVENSAGTDLFSVSNNGNVTSTGWFNIGSTDVVGTLGSTIGAGDLFVSDDATITDSFMVATTTFTVFNGSSRETNRIGINAISATSTLQVGGSVNFTNIAERSGFYFNSTTGRVGIGSNTSPRSLFTLGNNLFEVGSTGNATSSQWFNIGSTDVVGTLGSLIGAGDLYVGDDATITGSFVVDTDTFNIDSSSNQVGIGSMVMTAGDQLSVLSDANDDWNQALFVSHANNAAENNTAIAITNTAGEGAISTGTRVLRSVYNSFTPVLAVSDNADVEVYGIDQDLALGSLDVGDANGLTALNVAAYGNNLAITGTLNINNPTENRDIALNVYGYNVDISSDLTITALQIVTNDFNSYAGRFANAQTITTGDGDLSANAYGVVGVSNGALTTNGDNTHFAGHFTAAGTADTNYGVWATASAGTTNWSGFFNAGDVHIADDLFLGATTESITDGHFNLDGDDVYLNGELGVNSGAFFDSEVRIAGNATSSAWFNIGTTDVVASFGTTLIGAGDLFIGDDATTTGSLNVDSGTLQVDSSGSAIGIGISPATGTKLDIDAGSNTLGIRIRGAAETTEIADILIDNTGALWLSTSNTGAAQASINIDPDDDKYGMVILEGIGVSGSYTNFITVDDTVDHINIDVNSWWQAGTPGLVIDAQDQIGIGVDNPAYPLDVNATSTGGIDAYVANFFHDGNDADYNGIRIQAGLDDGTGTTLYLDAFDGDGGNIGNLANTSGTFAVNDISDVRLKTNITDTIVNGLSVIEALRVVDFNRISSPNGPKITGFIAQEVLPIYPGAVSELSSGYLGIARDNFVPVIVKALQEQQTQIDLLQQQPSSTPQNSQPLIVIDNPDSDVRTLAVQEAATFYGTLYVIGEAGFEHKVVFHDDVEIEGKLYLSADQAGALTIEAGATSTKVLFNEEYQTVPYVTATIRGVHEVFYGITDVTKTGFRLSISQIQSQSLTFDWIALPPNLAAGSGPVIDELVVSQATVAAGGTVELWAKVTDPDTTESELNYEWSFNTHIGEVSGDSGLVYWTVASDVQQDVLVTITVTVSDGSRQSTASAVVQVIGSEPTAPEQSQPDPILGCTDSTAQNYNQAATQDDGSCTYEETETETDVVKEEEPEEPEEAPEETPGEAVVTAEPDPPEGAGELEATTN